MKYGKDTIYSKKQNKNQILLLISAIGIYSGRIVTTDWYIENCESCLLSSDRSSDSIYSINGTMKGTKVQTLGGRAVAGAWCMAGCLGLRAPAMGLEKEKKKRPWVQ